jgi:hypothetical protein
VKRPREVTMLSDIGSPFHGCATSTLLYFSNDAYCDIQLQDCLAEQGFRVRMVQTALEAAHLLLSAIHAEAVVIREDHIETGSQIACSFKGLCPGIPVILLSPRLPADPKLPDGVDALLSVNLHSAHAALGIAKVIGLLIELHEKQKLLAKELSEIYIN